MAEELTLEVGVDKPLAAASAAAATWEPWRGDLLAIPGRFPRQEVEAAFREYLERANANDWDAWCDLFTEDVHYVDHFFGVMEGLDAVRNWMVPLMAGQPEMKFLPGMARDRGRCHHQLQLEPLAQPRRHVRAVRRHRQLQ